MLEGIIALRIRLDRSRDLQVGHLDLLIVGGNDKGSWYQRRLVHTVEHFLLQHRTPVPIGTGCVAIIHSVVDNIVGLWE